MFVGLDELLDGPLFKMIRPKGFDRKPERYIFMYHYTVMCIQRGAESMKDFVIVKDPEVAKLFADENRRDILYNLRHREMTACQLARLLERNVSSISYHLNALEKAGLIEQTRTSVRGNLVEKFFRATADRFIISYTLSEGLVPGSEDIAKWTKEVCNGAVESLEVFGYHVPTDRKDDLGKLIERFSVLQSMAHEEVVSRQKTPVHVSRPALRLLLSLLTSIKLSRNPDYSKILDKIHIELESK